MLPEKKKGAETMKSVEPEREWEKGGEDWPAAVGGQEKAGRRARRARERIDELLRPPLNFLAFGTELLLPPRGAMSSSTAQFQRCSTLLFILSFFLFLSFLSLSLFSLACRRRQSSKLRSHLSVVGWQSR